MEPRETSGDRSRPPSVTRDRVIARLSAENAALQAENDRLRGTVGHADAVHLPLDRRAPGAARIVVGEHLRGHVAPGLVAIAQLLITELVTNSVLHSGAGQGETVSVRVELEHDAVRLEVEDPGGGESAPRLPDAPSGQTFGLRLVAALSERWGLEHIAEGETRAWAHLRCAPAPAAA